MHNERAALREKSAQLYDLQLLKVRQSLDRHIEFLANESVPRSKMPPARQFADIVRNRWCDSVLILGADGSLQYPVIPDSLFDDEFTDVDDQALEFHAAWLSESEQPSGGPAGGAFALPPIGPVLSLFNTEALRSARDFQGRQLFPSLQLLALQQGERSAAPLDDVVRALTSPP